VSGSADLSGVVGADFVIEAIFENLDAKKEALAAAEAHLAPSALLATNTSSLSIDAMAEALDHPERLIGFHVFNPVDSARLVEIIRGRNTDALTVATAFQLAQTLRRKAVVSADTPGFVVNRLLARLYDEVFRAIDAGGDPHAIDHSIDDLGLPMTPLRLLDFVGPAVQLHVTETMHKAFPDRFALPEWLSRVVGSGQRAVLQPDQSLNPIAAALLPRRGGGGSSLDLAAATRAAILDALTDEVHRILGEGIVARKQDVDKAMLLGANFPWAMGGLTPYLDARARSMSDSSIRARTAETP
jgi:3-hydroxyacyl-CoA dehydrogenase